MKHLKTILVISLLVFIAITGIGIAYSLYNKPHRQASTEKADIHLPATELYNAYISDEARADSLYLDKVLQVQGTVEKIITNEQGEKVLMLESPELFGISCTMADSTSKDLLAVNAGSEVTVKGICHGMLMDVVLVKCVLVDP